MNRWWLPLIVAAALAAARDAYKILGVTRKAGTRQIKKAFRQLSKQYHPDRNKENVAEAQQKFQDVAWAHEVLSNETTRKIYDQYGEDGLKKLGQGADPRRSGGGFPSGGFVFQSGGQQFFFSSGGPFGHHGPRTAHRPPHVEVDWFAESAVELLSRENKLDLEEMHPHWPDVFFLFRDDTESVELMAGSLNILAEELRSMIEFQAVDCRILPEMCRAFGLNQGAKFEIHLFTQTQASRLLKGDPRTPRTAALVSDESIDAETLMQWLIDKIPEHATPISSKATLRRFLTSNESKKAPSVLVVMESGEVGMKIRKLMSENVGRVSFGLVKKTKSNTRFRADLLAALAPAVPKKGKKLGEKDFMIHLVELEGVTPETVQIVALDESDFTIDMNLAVFVGTKRSGAGIYERVAKAMRPLTKNGMLEGVCGVKDKKYCVVYIIDPENDQSEIVQAAFAKYGNDAMRLFSLTVNKETTNEAFLSAFEAKVGDVIAWRPIRKRFLKTDGVVSAEQIGGFLEHVADGAALLHEGLVVASVPLVEV